MPIIMPNKFIKMADDPVWIAVAAVALFLGVVAYARIVIAPALRAFA
jgi:hypothetical protein